MLLFEPFHEASRPVQWRCNPKFLWRNAAPSSHERSTLLMPLGLWAKGCPFFFFTFGCRICQIQWRAAVMWFQLGHPNCSPPQLDHIVGLATPLHGNVTVCSCGGQSSFMVVHQCLQFYRIEMISFVDVKGMLKRVQKLVFFSPLHTFWHCRLFTVRIGTGQSFQLHKLRYFPCEICFFTGSPGATQT